MVIKVNIFQTEKTIEIQQDIRTTEVCGKVCLVRQMAKCLLRYHYYCPMLLMQTTKTDVCLQTNTIVHQLYGFLISLLAKFHA